MKKRFIFFSLCMVFTFVIGIITMGGAQNQNTAVMTSNSAISNKKIGWGIKRNDNHTQPDLGANNKKLIDENEDIAMGNAEEKVIYLTFDNGYEAGYTSKILDTLKQNNVKAAFFITGHYLNTQSELVERMIKENHIIGNHTCQHFSMPDLSDEDLKKEVQTLHTAVYEKFRL